MEPAVPWLIALDWGTTSLRAFLLGRDGAVLETRRAPFGIMRLPEGGFAEAHARVCGDWRARWPGLRSIASGMVGSAQGWVEAPYLSCPAGPEELAGALVPAPDGGPLVVPGLSQGGESPDVMRGEETEIAGVLALRPDLADAVRLVLPGTHSKWATVSDGRVRGFGTFMTGELFAVLRDHSILGRFARDGAPPADADAARDAFRGGVEAARRGARGAAPLLFGARALVLTGRLRPELALDHLSGLLVGEELRCALGEEDGAELVLVGDPALCRRYAEALAVFGRAAVPVIVDAAPAGLWRIAGRAGLCAAAGPGSGPGSELGAELGPEVVR